MEYKTLHPLSTLPYNVPYDILVEKYRKLLELYHSIKTEINILERLQDEDCKVNEENKQLQNK